MKSLCTTCKDKVACDAHRRCYGYPNYRVTECIGYEPKTEPTISKMEQVDKDINVRSKDEPQKDCNGCKFVGTYDTEFPCANCSRKTKDYYANDEPQTDTEIAKAIVHKMIDDAVIAEDAYPDLRQRMHDAVDEYEPQTERSEQ